MSDVFISYAAEDRARVQYLTKALEQGGFSVWWDRKIPPGKTWDQVIGKALDAAKCVIVLWSEVSVESNWVKEEADTAAQRGILVPALIDNVPLPIGFRRIEAANLIDWKGDSSYPEFKQLLESVSVLVAGRHAEQHQQMLQETKRPLAFSSLVLQKIKRNKRLAWLSTLAITGVAVVTALFLHYRTATRSEPPAATAAGERAQQPSPPPTVASTPAVSSGPIRVWKVGSPHEGDTPDATVPFDLQQKSERTGYELSVEGFPAKGFAAKFFDAFKKNEEPDILVIDNFGIIEGISTRLGDFTGIGASDSIHNSLIRVTGSFKEFEGRKGGWEFLLSKSKNYKAAKSLALQPTECNANWASLAPLLGELKEIVPSIASAYLDGAAAVLQRYEDRACLLVGGSGQEKVSIGSMRECGYWGNDNLAFVPVVATYEGEKSIGQTVILLIMRKQDTRWQLLTAARDPVSIGDFTKKIPRIVDLLEKNRGYDQQPVPAKLLSPEAGGYPKPNGGQRFGDFVWQPSPSPSVVAEIIEFAYGDDARLFIKFRSEQNPTEDRLSSGHMWSTGGVWRWRVWSISDSGVVSFSEARSFTNYMGR